MSSSNEWVFGDFYKAVQLADLSREEMKLFVDKLQEHQSQSIDGQTPTIVQMGGLRQILRNLLVEKCGQEDGDKRFSDIVVSL